jgi:prepilin-type N-terminal cleavage/methylation domain-containing protein
MPLATPRLDGGGQAIMRRGFTLMELLIVLAIIVVVLAASAPTLSRWAAQRQVQDAAKNVRSKLFKARLGAMHSSEIYAFQYQIGSGSYRLAPQDKLGQTSDSDASSSSQTALTDNSGAPPPEEGKLPEGMRFKVDTPEKVPADGNERTPSQSNGGSGWSDPVFFYPDGTTSDANFAVFDGRGYEVPITLRGVTGNIVMGNAIPVKESLP